MAAVDCTVITKTLSTLVLLTAATFPVFAGLEGERETADIKTGTTAITFSNAVAEALDTAEVIFKKAQPARINPGKGELTFVASGGAIDLANARTEIIHSGGITLAKEVPPAPTMAPKAPKQYRTATILDPIIEQSEAGAETEVRKITATIVVNGISLGRLDVFNVTGIIFAGPEVLVPKNKKLSATGVTLTLTEDAATALNEALGVPVFTADTEVASADIKLKLASDNL